MYNVGRAVKPKLSLSISAGQNAARPSLSLKPPATLSRTPISPVSTSPTKFSPFSALSPTGLPPNPAAGSPSRFSMFKGPSQGFTSTSQGYTSQGYGSISPHYRISPAYKNSCSKRSILKKSTPSRYGAVQNQGDVKKRIHFRTTPTVYCVTPIENPEEYYGKHFKMSTAERRLAREELRWAIK